MAARSLAQSQRLGQTVAHLKAEDGVDMLHALMNDTMKTCKSTGEYDRLPEAVKNALVVALASAEEVCPGCWVCGWKTAEPDDDLTEPFGSEDEWLTPAYSPPGGYDDVDEDDFADEIGDFDPEQHCTGCGAKIPSGAGTCTDCE